MYVDFWGALLILLIEMRRAVVAGAGAAAVAAVAALTARAHAPALSEVVAEA